jgi:hypothetical protein
MICPARARLAEDRHHQGRFSGAIGADQRDNLAAVDVDIDALQRLDLAVGGVQAADRKQRWCGWRHRTTSQQSSRRDNRRHDGTV